MPLPPPALLRACETSGLTESRDTREEKVQRRHRTAFSLLPILCSSCSPRCSFLPFRPALSTRSHVSRGLQLGGGSSRWPRRLLSIGRLWEALSSHVHFSVRSQMVSAPLCRLRRNLGVVQRSLAVLSASEADVYSLLSQRCDGMQLCGNLWMLPRDRVLHRGRFDFTGSLRSASSPETAN